MLIITPKKHNTAVPISVMATPVESTAFLSLFFSIPKRNAASKIESEITGYKKATIACKISAKPNSKEVIARV